MEGEHRPGHFNGVAQVVSKLFKIVEPNKAYFGQKDFQQLAIIKSMVKQLMLLIEIISCPIVREKSGLAMSSRNERLSNEERVSAGLISETLFEVEKLYKEKKAGELKKYVQQKINNSALKLEYFEITNCETLEPIADFEFAKNAVACIALHVGPVRLIDNVLLN